MLKVAMLSKWHVHAKDYAEFIQKSPNAEIVANWDEIPARGEEWAKELGCTFEPDLDKLLARTDIDAVICDTPTTMHHEVMIKAAKAGKHIFTEKALAPTVAACKEIVKVIEESGITFTISYPLIGDSVVQLAKKMIDNGDFGKVSMVRFRRAHSGVIANWLPDYWFEEKDAAGGALMDLGCHGLYIASYLLGKPKRVSSMVNILFGSPVDENATTSVEFENGAFFNAETGFVTSGLPDILEVHGEKAILMAAGQAVTIYKDGTPSAVSVLEPRKPMPLDVFIDACANGKGTPVEYGLDAAIALTTLLENSYISDKENRTIALDK